MGKDNSIKTIIADNDTESIEALLQQLERIDQIEIIDTCQDGDSALGSIKNNQPDLIFIEIELPGINGMEVVKHLDEENRPQIVFISTQKSYAIQAFNLNVADYLLKPVRKERLNKTIELVKKNLSQKILDDAIPAFIGKKAKNKYLSRLLVKTPKKMFFIDLKKVIYIESSGNYVKIYSTNGNNIVRSSLKDLIEKLDPEKFARIHKSIIVNIDKIVEIEKWFTGDYEVLLSNGEKVKMSRNYKENLYKFKI